MNNSTENQNILVVKLGGGAGLDLEAACSDLAQLARSRPLIVVHGVSARMNELCEARNIPVRTLTSPAGHSSRYTDARTRDVFVEAANTVNSQICDYLANHGVAVTSFADAVPIQGSRKTAIRAVVDGRVRIVRDDYSGSITGVDAAPLREALAQGIVPILPPLADSDDGLLNIDGDRAAAAIAAALGADTLVILSNVAGLYRDFELDSHPVPHVSPDQVEMAMEWAQGRMKRKVLGAREALDGGVTRVVIGDGRQHAPVSHALNGSGTVFSAQPELMGA